MARSRCSVEEYSSPRRRASPSASSITRRARGSIDSEPPWIRARRARIAASSPRKPGRSTPSRRSVSAGIPSSGSTSADRMCSASRIGLSSRWAVAWAAMMASWAFWVNRSSCIGWFSLLGGGRSPRVGLVDEVEEGAGGGPGVIGQAGRQGDLRLDVQVAVTAGLEAGHALAGQPERAPGLRAGRDGQEHTALERLDRYLGAEQGLLEGERKLSLEVGAAPREGRVGQDAHDDDEVAAGWSALAELDPGTRGRPGRDCDLETLAVDLHESGRPPVGLGQADLGLRLIARRRRGS